jgi:hypothetical protein
MSHVANHQQHSAAKFSWKKRREREQTGTVEKWAPWILIAVAILWLSSVGINFKTVVTLINLLALGLAVYGVREPGLGLLGVGMMCTIDTLTRTYLLTGGLFRWNTLNYWLVLTILLNFPLFLRFNDLHSRLLQVLLVLMAAMLTISLYVSLGIQDLLNMTASFGILIYFVKAYREPKMHYWLALVCAGLAGMSGTAYYIFQPTLSYLNPNSFIQLPLMGLFTICLAVPQARNIRGGRLILILLASICLALVFLSGSRGGLLAAGVCCLYLLFSLRSISWASVWIVCGLLAVLIFSTALSSQEQYAIHRITKLFDTSYTLAQRTSGRSDILWTGWQIFLEEPLGIGTGSFRTGASYLNILGGEDRPAHSAWIKTLAENGLQGFLLMTAWVFSFAFRGLQRKEPERLFFGILVSAVMAAGFVTTEFQGKHLWFLMASGIAVLNPEKVEAWLSQQKPAIIRKRKRKVEHLSGDPSVS